MEEFGVDDGKDETEGDEGDAEEFGLGGFFLEDEDTGGDAEDKPHLSENLDEGTLETKFIAVMTRKYAADPKRPAQMVATGCLVQTILKSLWNIGKRAMTSIREEVRQMLRVL